MALQTVSGIILISGFALVFLASLIDAHGVYDKNLDSAGRLEVVNSIGRRWLASNGLYALASLVTGAGFVLFAIAAWGDAPLWLNLLGVLSAVLASLLLARYIAIRGWKPKSYFTSLSQSPFFLGWFWLATIQSILYGAIFIIVPYSVSIGASSIGIALVLAVLATFRGTRFFSSFPPQVYFLVSLVMGIVLL